VGECLFLLVPAYPGCPGSKAVKRSLLLLLLLIQEFEVIDDVRILKPMFKQRLAANSKALVITDLGLFLVHCNH